MITRRLFLRSSAAAGASFAAVTAPVIADAAQKEDPILLDIRDRMPAAAAAFRAASVAMDAAVTRFAEIAPVLPDELICTDRREHWLSERETDCRTKEVWPRDMPGRATMPRRIYAADRLKGIAETYPRRSKLRSRYARLYQTALTYEKAFEASRVEVGIAAREEELYLAIDTLRRMASKASKTVPNSLTGLVIKAEVLHALTVCSDEDAGWALAYARQLPDDILALFGGGVA
jgi:hypothetical protein